MNGNGQALVNKLTEQAKDPVIVTEKEKRLKEVREVKESLKSERAFLDEKIKTTNYSSETATRDDIQALQRLGATINLSDDKLVAYDKELTRIEDEINIVKVSLFTVEMDIRKIKRNSNVLNEETKQYADEAESIITAESLSLLKQAHIDLAENLNGLFSKKSELLKSLCELIKARATILAKRSKLEEKVQELSVESEKLNRKIETDSYNDETLEAIDNAKFAYLERSIEECEKIIAHLSESPDRLRKQALEALRKGETEKYDDLVDKLRSLSEIEETPQYPEEIGTYFLAEAAKPSENRLRRMIFANKDALPSIKIKTNLKLNKNVDIIVEIAELLYLQARYQVAMAEAEILPETSTKRTEMIQKCQLAISNIETVVSDKQDQLVESEKIILDNMAKQRLYAFAINSLETDCLVLAGGEDLNLENYSMQNDMILAKHSAKKRAEAPKEAVKIEPNIPSYEELATESYELETPGVSLLEDTKEKEIDEVPTLEEVPEEKIEEPEIPTLEEEPVEEKPNHLFFLLLVLLLK